jgi:hypothetical protein
LTRLIGGASVLIGSGLILPAVVAWREQGAMPLLAYTPLLIGLLFVVCGSGAVIASFYHRSAVVPASVLGAVAVNALFLGLLSLEISHGISRQGGVVAKSAYVFPFALALFVGLVCGQRWTWHLARWGSLGFALFYFGVSVAVCILRPTDRHGPVWIWIALVGLALGSILLLGGFYALSRPSARLHFGAGSAE